MLLAPGEVAWAADSLFVVLSDQFPDGVWWNARGADGNALRCVDDPCQPFSPSHAFQLGRNCKKIIGAVADGQRNPNSTAADFSLSPEQGLESNRIYSPAR